MMVDLLRRRPSPSRLLRSAFALVFATVLLFGGTGVAAHGGKSNAKISGSFADACRDLVVRSSKDISYVEVRFIDGRVVKDERIKGHSYKIEGGPGDEIDSATVKSGRTVETFTCPRASSPPAAVLEIFGPCGALADGTLSCDAAQPRDT